MILAAQNERTHSARFVQVINLTMRRCVFLLGLCLLCGAFASVDGHLRPPDAASTDDGFFNLPSSHLYIRVVFFVVPDAEAAPSAPSEPSSGFDPKGHLRDVVSHVSCRHLSARVLTCPFRV